MATRDQAEGLRRLLAVPSQRVLSCLSVLSATERNSMMINLSASFAKQGKPTLMVDAHRGSTGVSAWLNLQQEQTLLQVARRQRSMDAVIKDVSFGLTATRLLGGEVRGARLSSLESRELAKVFDMAVSRAEMVVVDCEPDLDGSLLLSSLDETDFLIQMSCHPDSIKHAYGLIKLLHYRQTTRTYGIVVSGGAQVQAERVFSNLSLTARKYLGIELDFVGMVIDDVYSRRATELGRAVIDAFPGSKAAAAFMKIAHRLCATASDGLRFDSISA